MQNQNNNYQKQKHRELIIKNQTSKSLSKTEIKELENYSEILFNQLIWESKESFLELISDLIYKEKEFCFFRTDFSQLYNLLSDKSIDLENNLILLSPDKKSFHFGRLIGDIFDICFSSSETRIYDEETEELIQIYYNEIKQIFIKLEKFL